MPVADPTGDPSINQVTLLIALRLNETSNRELLTLMQHNPTAHCPWYMWV
jgi:hypothetical protein